MIQLLTLIMLVFSVPALAEEKVPFCDALSKEETYKGWEYYRYLLLGDDGWIFRTQSDFKTNIVAGEKDIARLKKLNDAFAEKNIHLVASVIPMRGITDGDKAPLGSFDPATVKARYGEAIRLMREAGLTVAAAEQYDGDKAFYYKRDHHWTPFGAKAMAEEVAALVKKKGISLPSKKFVTESRGLIDHEGTFERLITEACKEPVIPEKVEDFTTFSPDDQTNLFGDTEKPKIVLLGTSNSTSDASHANYDGFLKEALSVDVDNRAISGGGPDGAMLQWLASKNRADNPITLAVWEFPVHQDYYSKNFLRQAIPAVYGECEAPVASSTVPANADFVKVSRGWGDKKIEGENYYFHLTFSAPYKKDFRIVTQWNDGESDYFTFRRDAFYVPDGIYFLNFEGRKPPLDGVDLQFSEPPGGTVTVTVCKR